MFMGTSRQNEGSQVVKKLLKKLKSIEKQKFSESDTSSEKEKRQNTKDHSDNLRRYRKTKAKSENNLIK